MANPEYDFLFKMVLVGDDGVGKSCLMSSFAEGKQYMHTANYMPTIGVDFKIRTINVEGRVIKLQLWDTAGAERFRSITTSYYRGANGVVIIYDITNQKSFDNVPKWVKEVESYANPNSKTILIGNKGDLEMERIVDYSTGKKFADSVGLSFAETSAKISKNVEQAFLTLVSDIKNKSALDGVSAPSKLNALDVGDSERNTSAGQEDEVSTACDYDTLEEEISAGRIFRGKDMYKKLLSMKKSELSTYLDSKSKIVGNISKCGKVSTQTENDMRVLAIMVHSVECSGL
ncbi:ras-related protein ORAB-1-like [Mytilus edulis]|uniref:ras-related protein ORAB-1-like n=1 Tax=Mytilus edulis TaxID=6550 RepID=UPI0039EE6A27